MAAVVPCLQSENLTPAGLVEAPTVAGVGGPRNRKGHDIGPMLTTPDVHRKSLVAAAAA